MFRSGFKCNYFSSQSLYRFAGLSAITVGGYMAYQELYNQSYTSTPVLHYYAANGSEEEIRELKKTWGRGVFQYDATAVTCNGGNNPLHLAVKYNHPCVVELVVDSMGDKAIDATKQTNHDGKIAIEEVIMRRPHATFANDYTSLFRILKPATLEHRLPSITSLVDKEEIAKKYPDIETNSKEYKNLMQAIDAINETRQALGESGTHPSLNSSHLSWLRATTKIHNMRIDCHKEIEALENATIEQQYEIRVKHAFRERAGNCHEYCYGLIHFLRQKKVNASIRMYSIRNGDHVVVVLDDHLQPTSSINETAIVCDPWYGKAYLARDILSELNNFVSLNEMTSIGEIHAGNVCATFNPKVHELSLLSLFKNKRDAFEIPTSVETERLRCYLK